MFIGSKESGYTAVPGLPPATQGNHWQFGITIVTPDRKFLFACETEEEQKEWKAVFQSVINRPMLPQEYAGDLLFTCFTFRLIILNIGSIGIQNLLASYVVGIIIIVYCFSVTSSFNLKLNSSILTWYICSLSLITMGCNFNWKTHWLKFQLIICLICSFRKNFQNVKLRKYVNAHLNNRINWHLQYLP